MSGCAMHGVVVYAGVGCGEGEITAQKQLTTIRLVREFQIAQLAQFTRETCYQTNHRAPRRYHHY